jgi:hypothetical protein
MIQSNRVTIIVDDSAVYLDTGVLTDLDFSQCGIPEDVHALQWLDDKGHVEFRGQFAHNEPITALPEWSINCIAKWEEAIQLNPPA